MDFKHVDQKLLKPVAMLNDFFRGDVGFQNATAHMQVEIGMADDHVNCYVPPRARYRPAFVGDARFRAPQKTVEEFLGNVIGTAEAKEILKSKGPDELDTGYVWVGDSDFRKGKYVPFAEKRRMVADGMVADANAQAPALIGMQQFSPWNVGWFQQIFRAPLLYSKALDLVKVESGTEPWAEIMNLQLADYVGFATLESTGRLSNNYAPNVNVRAGLMTTPVIHMAASYDLGIEELKRAEQSGSPFGQQMITLKQQYTDYVLHMLTSYLIYYGNTATETVGLLQVPSSITSYSGSSMNAIYLNNTTNPGAAQLSALLSIIIPFLDALHNRAETLIIAMSPQCYNRMTVPYSTTYNPTAALKAAIENLIAGKQEDGTVPNVQIVIDPLLEPSTSFNAQTYDYTLLISPRMKTGPTGATQPMVMFGAPLMEFVYPTIPGSYDTQYKFLRRVAGVFCPVAASVAAYSGFGIKSPTT